VDRSLRKIGVLGAGFISDFHIQALKGIADVEVTAICDSEGHKARHASEKWGIGLAFSSLEDMLSSGSVNTVHLIVPPLCHAESAVRCMEHGCDVFMEKPMTVTLEQARAVQQASVLHGRSVGVNHNFTFNPAFSGLVSAIRDWRLGEVEHVTVCWNVPLRQLDTGQHSHWMFQEPGNIILEQGAHPLSLICTLLGGVREVSAIPTGKTMLNTGRSFFDTWQCSLVCERGAAQLFMSFGREWYDFWVHTGGQDGSAFADIRRNRFTLSQKTRFMNPVDDFLDGLKAACYTLGQASKNLANYSRGLLRLVPAQDPYPLGMRLSIEGFYEDLFAGRKPRQGVEQGVDVVQACEAIIRNGKRWEGSVGTHEAVQHG
jgi:predicted dehydrogenase